MTDIAEKLEEILDVLAEIRGGEPQRLRRLERAFSARPKLRAVPTGS